MRESLAIVVDRQFGARIEPLIADRYVWMIHSTVNQFAFDRVIAKLSEAEKQSMLVTIGVPEYELPDAAQEFEVMLDSAIEHFPHLRRMQVLGDDFISDEFCDAAFAVRGFTRDASQSKTRHYQAVDPNREFELRGPE